LFEGAIAMNAPFRTTDSVFSLVRAVIATGAKAIFPSATRSPEA
jgi:hypothetical protein